VFPALLVGDLAGDALNCVEMQLLFGATFPLLRFIRINATIERAPHIYPTEDR